MRNRVRVLGCIGDQRGAALGLHSFAFRGVSDRSGCRRRIRAGGKGCGVRSRVHCATHARPDPGEHIGFALSARGASCLLFRNRLTRILGVFSGLGVGVERPGESHGFSCGTFSGAPAFRQNREQT